MIATLEPIDLDELVAEAPLLTRVDRKYVLPVEDLPLVFAGLAPAARVLEIDGRREFDYHSVYFDTPDLRSYLDAAHRRKRRFKARLRCYVESGTQFFEVKTRGRRGETVKHRMPCRALGPDARAFAAGVLADAGIAVDPADFTPTLTTRYRRTTLFLPDSRSRVTVDTDLVWTLPSGAAFRTPDRVVVETKSARASGPADRLLWSLGHRPRAISKYATGLAALRPDLPANHWTPVLRRHFSVGAV